MVFWAVLAPRWPDGEDITARVKSNVRDLLTVRRANIKLTHVRHVAWIGQLPETEFRVGTYCVHEVVMGARRPMCCHIHANDLHELFILCLRMRFKEALGVLDFGFCRSLSFIIVVKIEEMLLQFHWNHFPLNFKSRDLTGNACKQAQ